MNPYSRSSGRLEFGNRRDYLGCELLNGKKPLAGRVTGFSGSLKKTRSDYEEQLKSVLKSSGLQTVRSLPKLPSPKVYQFEKEKVESLKNKYWESKYQEKINTARGQKKKVTFLMTSAKSDPKKIDYTKLLNQEILEFERRLENYNSSKQE